MQRTRAATEAIFLLLKLAADDLGYRRLVWKCNALNAPSKRAAERLGFTYEGRHRMHMVVKGHLRDTDWYSIVGDEWPPLPRRAAGLARSRQFRRPTAPRCMAWPNCAQCPMSGTSLLPWRRPRINVIVLHGTIAARPGMLNADSARPLIEKAFASPASRPVILDIESPGGSPVQSDLIAGLIRSHADRAGRPRPCRHPRGRRLRRLLDRLRR